jgi:Carboxypeptidase regulatory-like domain/TonB dependent receptor
MRVVHTLVERAAQCLMAAALIGALTGRGAAQQAGEPAPGARTQAIVGQVTDEQEAVIVGAKVTITDARKSERSSNSDREGKFAFLGLEPGAYTITIRANNFTIYGNPSVKVAPEQKTILNVTLRVAPIKQAIAVLSGNPLVRGAEFGGSSIVLRGEALDELPDGPGGLEEMLRALALRSAGPFGPQILVNGFEDNPIPSKQSIREIRINDNPFSAEYPQLGLGRIEILTKPGTDKLHGNLYFMFGDANLNSRNPFAPNRAPFQSKLYGGDISGPIVAKRAAFYIDFSQEKDRSNAVISATVLDRALNISPFREAVVTPERRRFFAPSLDVQLSAKNTLVARYSDNRSEALNAGVGGFSLLSRSQNSTTAVQTAQLTETAVLNANTIAETRFQYVRNRMWQSGNNSTPVISVPGAFTGGGADVGLSYDFQSRVELHHFTSWQVGRHIIKAGVQLKYIRLADGSTQNFGGTYTFNGRLAPELNSLNQVVLDGIGAPALLPITGIEAYRRTMLFQSLGLPTAEIRQFGGGPSQLSLAAGQIETGVRQYELGTFLQDDWRLNSKLSLNMGLRYEGQNNIRSGSNLAPRFGFAWGLGGKDQPKTVLRGGVGVYYTRIGEGLVLTSRQMNGVNQRQFISTDASVLDLFPSVLSPSLLADFAVPASTVRLAPNLRAPYTIHSSLAIERQFGRAISVAATYARIRTVHMLRSRNINAPLPGTYNAQFPGSAVRPLANAGNVFEYEASGIFDQNQLLTNFVYRANKRLTLWSTYTFSNSKSDTDGADTFPANTYDLRTEYGRSSQDFRHSVYWGGWISLKGGIDLVPLVLWRSGMPFNITTGIDNNGDSLFTDRPAFAMDLTRPSVIVTRFGAFDIDPLPGQRIIPRNIGQGPDFLIANLRIFKKLRLNDRVSMSLSVQGQNILNHTNGGLPIGNLSSPLFGISNASAGDWGLGSNSAGNRRFLLGLFFAF